MDMRVSAEELRLLVHYSPDTGAFTWLVNRPRVRVGSPAGCVGLRGYLCIKIRGRLYAAHRLAWLYMTGEWPSQTTDHINGVRTDNRFTNLRDVSASANAQNMRTPPVNNTTGFLGVTQRRGKFEAQIALLGSKLWLGAHATPEAAHEAYIEAKRNIHEGNTL